MQVNNDAYFETRIKDLLTKEVGNGDSNFDLCVAERSYITYRCCIMLSAVDVHDKRLTDLESLALRLMLEKRQEYVRAGRARDAHGLGTGIWILWKTLTLQQPGSTGYGGL